MQIGQGSDGIKEPIDPKKSEAPEGKKTSFYRKVANVVSYVFFGALKAISPLSVLHQQHMSQTVADIKSPRSSTVIPPSRVGAQAIASVKGERDSQAIHKPAHKQPSTTDRKTTALRSSLQIPAPTHNVIDRGKAKEVNTKPGNIDDVFYTALPGKESELKEEVQTVKKINSNLDKEIRNELKEAVKKSGLFPQEEDALVTILMDSSKSNTLNKTLEGYKKTGFYNTETFAKLEEEVLSILGEKNLVLDLVEVSGSDKIEGQYTVRTRRAETNNLEKRVAEGQLDLETKKKFSKDLANGLANLHQAGYVHGDLKPENILLFGDTARISDYGKTREVRGDEKVLHLGNARYAPPEGKNSKKGETWSAGIMLIRIWESGRLKAKNDMLILPETDPHVTLQKERAGIERFLVLDKDCPQNENTGLYGRVRVVSHRLSTAILTSSPSNLKKTEEKIHLYIDALIDGGPDLTSEQANELSMLLKRMTAADPSNRPTMVQVQKYLNDIFP